MATKLLVMQLALNRLIVFDIIRLDQLHEASLVFLRSIGADQFLKLFKGMWEALGFQVQVAETHANQYDNG